MSVQEQSSGGAPAAQAPNIAQDLKSAEPEVLVGTLSFSEGQVILSTSSGECLLEGRDLSSVVGMTVKVTGAVMEKADRRVIEVTSAEQVQ